MDNISYPTKPTGEQAMKNILNQKKRNYDPNDAVFAGQEGQPVDPNTVVPKSLVTSVGNDTVPGETVKTNAKLFKDALATKPNIAKALQRAGLTTLSSIPRTYTELREVNGIGDSSAKWLIATMAKYHIL